MTSQLRGYMQSLILQFVVQRADVEVFKLKTNIWGVKRSPLRGSSGAQVVDVVINSWCTKEERLQ